MENIHPQSNASKNYKTYAFVDQFIRNNCNHDASLVILDGNQQCLTMLLESHVNKTFKSQ